MGYEHILVEVDPPIATVTLNRPKVLNALSPELMGEVVAALAELDGNEAVRSVVLTGGRRIEVHPGFDPSTFERLVGILERA